MRRRKASFKEASFGAPLPRLRGSNDKTGTGRRTKRPGDYAWLFDNRMLTSPRSFPRKRERRATQISFGKVWVPASAGTSGEIHAAPNASRLGLARMYEAADDPYCYPGTAVLKNRLGLRSQEQLDAFEAEITTQRGNEAFPDGTLDDEHYRSIHRHLFQDIFDWAGTIRTVRITKGASTFCYPENIDAEMRKLFRQLAADDHLRGLAAEAFAAKAAHVLAELNAIHPFREGNGRTQNAFLKLVAERAGHPLDFERLNPPDMMQAMVASFAGNEAPLAALILRLMRG